MMDRLINADKLVDRIEAVSKPDDTIKVWQMIEMIECTPAEYYRSDDKTTPTKSVGPFLPHYVGLDCPNCGGRMVRMWESCAEEEEGHIATAVYHCDKCNNDTELVRHFDKKGYLTSIHPHRYYYGV